MNFSQGKRDIEYVIRENKIIKEENEILREQVLGNNHFNFKEFLLWKILALRELRENAKTISLANYKNVIREFYKY